MQHSLPSLLRGLILLTFLFPPLIFSAGPAECFFLDGTAATDHEPCIPATNRSETTHSPCCVLGQPVGNNMDICTSQGLCFGQRSSNSMGFLYQGGCTDSSLADASCRWPCAPLTNGTKFFVIIPCSNGEFCCSALDNSYGIGDPSCCSGSTFQAGFSLVLQATSSVAQTTSSAASCTATGNPSSFDPTVSCPKNETVVVGASVGGVLGSILLVALATIVLLWRKLGQERRQYQQHDCKTGVGNTAVQYIHMYETDGQQLLGHELPASNRETAQ